MVTLHKKPEVSIIMATYNRAHLIHESLTSIQNQTFENWECIIIDDGSTDETKEAIKPSLSDSRFRYLPRSAKHKKGLPGCRNYGIELAKGDYIVFFDDDDIAHPNHFKITIPILKKNDFHFCHYTREVFFGEFNREFNRNLNYSSKHIDYKNLEKIITHELPFNSCAVIWKKECFFNNRFNEELLYAEEWELYSRLLSNGFTGISIDKTLYFGRKHNASNTGEFYLGDKIRRESKIKAIQLVAINLQEKELLTPFLTRYFIQLAFLLNDRALINFLGKLTNLSRTKIYRYQVIRRYYPLISKYLRFKKKYL
ncbi:glycosyltransferase family 2 protein [Salegentibacter sp. Hel_I_6]|uniref:glycosyltransferase family 2 protein n=1 Tax=Salegentibacter sp. Hel_I_6 TaxID=1250278 RepID=UPI00056956AA|nr:glycosyltransferase family 2 protein [Salegentibacter sp. Hel_I_6]